MKDKILEAMSLEVSDVDSEKISLTLPDLNHGDYTTNIALIVASMNKSNPRSVAEELVVKLQARLGSDVQVEVAGPGFINFRLSDNTIFDNLDSHRKSQPNESKKIFVEYAHPNTHKEMHIGHMRTLITGEAISRLFESQGEQVFRGNYQGDIGPHVAKALYGLPLVLKDENLSLDDADKKPNKEKAHILGAAYVMGNQDYEENKEEIDQINNKLYESDSSIEPIYQKTRQWSLDYYSDFYARFYTKFDELFFESNMTEPGKKIVMDNIGKVFEKDNDAIVFKGEKYGLHTRVFITKAGHPTYEGKEMGNGFAEYHAFKFDKKIHIVANEQAGYFQVVFKALDLIDPEKFEGKQHHLSMGMVNLVGRKMSSRTGEILRVDDLIDQVKEKINSLVTEGRISTDNADEVTEQVAIGAIKYSILRVGPTHDVAFDIEKSISLEGASGPYIQYANVRCLSILNKSKANSDIDFENIKPNEDERELARLLIRFDSVVSESAVNMSPNTLADYLFTLAKAYNNYYQKHKVIGSSEEDFRVYLTSKVSETLERGLDLLGIKSPKKM